MARKGRPANNQPKTAWQYRRVLMLVQVLALDKSEGLHLTDLQVLARGWDVNPFGTYQELLTRLALHALEAAREDGEHGEA